MTFMQDSCKPQEHHREGVASHYQPYQRVDASKSRIHGRNPALHQVTAQCRACVAVPEMLEDVIPADLGANQSKLNAVTSKSAQVTLTSRIVPPSHNTNSIRPGRKSHQRTRSSGLSEIPCGLFLRFPRAEINCA